jgi:hypothetical protein
MAENAFTSITFVFFLALSAAIIKSSRNKFQIKEVGKNILITFPADKE